MADLQEQMILNMGYSVQEVENLRRQRDYYNRIQNQGAFDQSAQGEERIHPTMLRHFRAQRRRGRWG